MQLNIKVEREKLTLFSSLALLKLLTSIPSSLNFLTFDVLILSTSDTVDITTRIVSTINIKGNITQNIIIGLKVNM